jgi:hypothetical protein
LRRIIEWLCAIAPAGVVEFVPMDDPMARRLLRLRDDAPDGYSQAAFETELGRHFRIVARGDVPDSSRVLYAYAR